MQVAAEHQLPVSPERVIQWLTDPDQAQPAVGLSPKAETQVRLMDDGGVTITVRSFLPVEEMPSAVRAVAGGSVELRQAIAWQPAGPDGSRVASLAGEIAGAPVQLEGTLLLAATKDGSQLSIDAQINANVPLFGGAIEQAGARMVTQLLQDQVAALELHLAQ